MAAKDPTAVERANLLNMAKLSIKGLIESALSFGRTLDSDYPPLQQFFVVMEHCLKHGLKVRKSFLSYNKTIWGPLELVEKLYPEAEEIGASVRDLPGLKKGEQAVHMISLVPTSYSMTCHGLLIAGVGIVDKLLNQPVALPPYSEPIFQGLTHQEWTLTNSSDGKELIVTSLLPPYSILLRDVMQIEGM